jgi:hypothetical protein
MENFPKDEILDAIKNAVKEAVEANPLSSDEIQWVRMAIENEARRAEYRKAIIEKTLGGLAWSALGGIGLYILDLVKSHWR